MTPRIQKRKNVTHQVKELIGDKIRFVKSRGQQHDSRPKDIEKKTISAESERKKQK